MKIFDILKRKKEGEKEAEKEVRIKKSKPEVKKAKAKIEKKPETKVDKSKIKKDIRKDRRFQEAYRILKAPHITEKATDLTKSNQYVFKVFPKANKVEIRKAIEEIYGVDVLSVNIINVPSKRRRLGRISGWKKGYKKAIIKIKPGQKIEVLPR